MLGFDECVEPMSILCMQVKESGAAFFTFTLGLIKTLHRSLFQTRLPQLPGPFLRLLGSLHLKLQKFLLLHPHLVYFIDPFFTTSILK